MENQKRQELKEKISKEIHSDKSPVGIDAKKTHIMILMELAELRDELRELKDIVTKMQ
jgi:hypothetical protein